MNILITIIIFSILVVVHEFGHFIVARRSGIRVERFAIGFGPPLLRIKGKETEFLICLFPLGGYVKLAGDIRSECKGLNYEFFSKPPGIRAKVVFFGSFFNFILAFIIFWVIFIIFGFPSPEPIVGKERYKPVAKSEFTSEQLQKLTHSKIIEEAEGNKEYAVWVGSSIEDKLQLAGFKDDKVKHFLQIWQNSHRVTSKDEFTKEQLQEFLDKEIVKEKVVYWTVFSEEELKAKLSENEIANSEGILSILRKCRSPAYKAGMKEGDKVIEVNGERVSSWEEMSKLIRASEDIVRLTVLRDKNEKEIEVIPKRIIIQGGGSEEEVSVIGIWSKLIRGGIVSAFIETLKEVGRTVGNFFVGLTWLITKKVAFKEAVAGPIGIAVIIAKVAKTSMVSLFKLTGILSLILAIINLFPFPVLDGGHLFFIGIERLRGKPLLEKWENRITQAGAVVLISFMLFVIYNDISKATFKKDGFTQEQFQKLQEKKIVRKIEDGAKYVFWAIPVEDKLRDKLSEIKILNIENVLGIWRRSPKVTEILND